MNEKIATIRELSSRPEMILQLAEEANELCMAALELKKVMVFRDSGSNILKENFIEEIADVKLSIDIIGNYLDNIEAFEMRGSKYELLENLSKYCCELSKTAIKLRRIIVPTASPTPVTENEAEQKMIKLITRIKSCINSVGNYWDSDEVNNIYEAKANRCIERMKK